MPIQERYDALKTGLSDTIGSVTDWTAEIVAGEDKAEAREKAGLFKTIGNLLSNTKNTIFNVLGLNGNTNGILFSRNAMLNPFRVGRDAVGGITKTTAELVGDALGTTIGTQHGRRVEQLIKGAVQTGVSIPLGSIQDRTSR